MSKHAKESKEICKSVNEARRNYNLNMGMYKRDSRLLEQLSCPIYLSILGGIIPKIIRKELLEKEQKDSISSAKQFLEEWEKQSRREIEIAIDLKRQKRAIDRYPMNDLFLQIQEIEEKLNNPDSGENARDPLINAESQLFNTEMA